MTTAATESKQSSQDTFYETFRKRDIYRPEMTTLLPHRDYVAVFAQLRRTNSQIVLANRQELVLPIEAQQHRDHYEPVQYDQS
jgi:hypothetical protein